MRATQELTRALQNVITDMGYTWPAKAVIESPKGKHHCDLAANVAMVLAKEAHCPPRELAAR
ncbi:MAG: arginine--tRNA ligase, partial [Desulfovibrionaceae bacterium]